MIIYLVYYFVIISFIFLFFLFILILLIIYFDLLTRIRNANIIGSEMVLIPKTNLALSILKLLKNEGFIDGFDIFKSDLSSLNSKSSIEYISVRLKFKKGSILKPYISCINRVSKPGLRVYSRVSNLPVVFGGIGVAIFLLLINLL